MMPKDKHLAYKVLPCVQFALVITINRITIVSHTVNDF